MKRRVIRLSTLARRLPRGFAPPAAFGAFVKTAAQTDPARHGFFNVMWSDPSDFGLRRECRDELIPFLRLGDGGLVAFWKPKTGANSETASNLETEKTPPVVHMDSEGQNRVAAVSFDDFLARLALRKTGVPDIDEAAEPFPFPKKFPRPSSPVKIPPALRARFAAWCGANADKHAPASGAANAAALEKLRKKLHALALATLRDGFNTVYKVRDEWWTVNLRVTRKAGAHSANTAHSANAAHDTHSTHSAPDALQITYLDYGAWKPLPAAYGAAPLIRDLLAHAKHPRRAACEITIIKTGLVSVDRDRELVLEPAPAATPAKKN
jgi:hypothetical protein